MFKFKYDGYISGYGRRVVDIERGVGEGTGAMAPFRGMDAREAESGQ